MRKVALSIFLIIILSTVLLFSGCVSQPSEKETSQAQNNRWRVTYKIGKQDILCSPTIIRKLVIKGDIIKIEKKKVRVVLSGGYLRCLNEEDLTDWKDVTAWYK
jgi:PBP1b-binding outer membrane lipoprotein LpoB